MTVLNNVRLVELNVQKGLALRGANTLKSVKTCQL
jgi:hypothetical protein